MEAEENGFENILHLRKRYVYLVLFLVSVAAFSQIFFFQFPVKWDMINCFLPWKYQVGECLQNNTLPLWNPYVNLGVPINADPSSGAWYPITWIIGYFKGYSVYLIGIELWLHVFIAGIGFYKLSKTLGLFSFFALLAGIAYMLSGFFVGNAQHLPYIISACWLPFLIHYYIKMVHSDKWSDVIKASFVVFLTITGGYPAFTIILFYFILIFFIYYLIKTEKRKAKVGAFIIKHAALIIISLLASSVMIFSVLQAFPFLTRMETFNVQQALFSPFSPQSFVSFIYPYASVIRAEDAYFDSDLSMRNGYFGIITLILFLVGIFYKKTSEIKIIFGFGILALMASVGNYLPVREFLFDYVPLMGLFRFPSVFRLFFILSAIITGIYFLQLLITSKELNRKPFMIALLVSIVSGVVVLHFALNDEAFNIANYISENLFRTNPESTFWKHIAIQSLVQLVLLICLFFFMWKIKQRRNLLFSILGLFMFDLVISTQLNAPSTIYSYEWSAKSTSKLIEDYPHGFPMVGERTVKTSNDKLNLGQQYWANTSVFSREISSIGFNSFIFTSYEQLQNGESRFGDTISLNKVVYLSDEVFPTLLQEKMSEKGLLKANTLFFDKDSYSVFENTTLKNTSTDQISITDFGPFFFKIESKTKAPQILTLLQKKYPGWTATVNGKEANIHLSNNNFISILLPKGENKIIFTFKNTKIISWFYVSLISLITMALFLLFNHYKKT